MSTLLTLLFLGFIALVVLLYAALFVVTVIAALFERRLVWQYAPVAASPAYMATAALDRSNPYAVSGVAPASELPPLSVEAATASTAAQMSKFQPLGTYRDAKGGIYRVRYEFWVSPERDVVAGIGCGKVAAMQVSATWLHTRLADGREFVVIDQQSASEYDLSSTRLEALVTELSFADLVQEHRKRVRALGVGVARYGDDPMAELQQQNAVRVRRLVERGYARYLDPQESAWKYSVYGAIVLAVLVHAQALRRLVSPD